MPNVLREDISVHIIQSRDHILNTYSQKISEYAEKRFARNEIDTILNARVKEVTPTSVIYSTKDEAGKAVEHTLESNFVLWSTGIAMNPFTERVASLLPNQYHRHALEVDSHLRVVGAPLGTVYALGDCATIETRLVDHLLEIVDRCDENKDGVVDEREFERMIAVSNSLLCLNSIFCAEYFYVFVDCQEKIPYCYCSRREDSRYLRPICKC